LLFCAGPVAASPRRARGVSPLQPRRLGCTPLRSARVPCGTTRADATGHQLALRDAQASRAPLRLGARSSPPVGESPQGVEEKSSAGPVAASPGHPLLFRCNGSPATGNPLLSEWDLSRSSPVERRLRRCSPADSPAGALAHRCAQLRATHSNCNGSKRRRSPEDPAAGSSAPPGSHAAPPAPRISARGKRGKQHADLSGENAARGGLVFRVLSKAKGLRRRSVDTCLARMRMKMPSGD
jgi:hypothetical protein